MHTTADTPTRRLMIAVGSMVVAFAAVFSARAQTSSAAPRPAAQNGAATNAQASRAVIRGDHGDLASGAVVVVTSLSLDGVVIQMPGAAEGAQADRVIPWDWVASVQGPLSARAEFMSGPSQAAWRAMSRLERGDIVAAEPPLEELFPLYTGRRGPTAERIAAGLMACRLRRGAVAGAVAPWLAWSNARSTTQPVSLELLAGLVDPQSGLAPGLPPIWLSVASTDALARGDWLKPAADGAPLDAAALDLAALYEQSARFEAGLPSMLPPERSADPAVTIVREIVASRIAPPDRRMAARAALNKALADRPPAWLESWIRTALGRSLLMESDRESRLLGVAQLAHIPARLARESPYLTGVAIAEMAVALDSFGGTAGAQSLKRELASAYTGHPALEWPPLRAISLATPKPAPPAAAEQQSTSGEGGPD